jgi:outer membrane lipopolysaccharide assembly protein LptE/RlpB
MRGFLSLSLLLLTAACGYHFEKGPDRTVSVVYALGDQEGELTDALVREFASSPGFTYVRNGGELCLEVKILGKIDDKIGFNYDRDDKSGKLRKNVVAVENRKIIRAEVTLYNSHRECLLGPMYVEADADYDYADQNSLRDLSLVDAGQPRRSSVSFSLGQLDTIDGAKYDATLPAFRLLAQKIVKGILAHYDDEICDP